jgi:2-polyprenyl-3-methyl-5-hydroxy-6-metoxy-1,4-benzoquinol methylase
LTSIDDTGSKVLNVIAGANNFNQWMYQTIKPFINGNILEAGSGTGNLSAFFIKDQAAITLSDTEEQYIDILREKFNDYVNRVPIVFLNLEHSSFEAKYSELKEKFDTVFLLNVLEHIKDDQQVVTNCRYLLKPGGTLLILTPAYSFLFAALDRSLGHHRRYTTGRLKELLSQAGIITTKKFYFNFLGIFAWLYGKILRLKAIPKGEMKVFDRLVPVAKMIDKIIFRSAGLSAVIIGKKDNIAG